MTSLKFHLVILLAAIFVAEAQNNIAFRELGQFSKHKILKEFNYVHYHYFYSRSRSREEILCAKILQGNTRSGEINMQILWDGICDDRVFE